MITTGYGFFREALVAQTVKNLPAMWETHPGLIPGWERCFGEANGYPLQYSRLENPMDRGDWQAAVQISAQSCPTLCNPMDCSTPGLPVHHQLLEFTQTHVHRVGDAIQPSHPLSSPSLPAFNLSQHQGLFQ